MFGVFSWYDVKKGYGFIKGEDGVDYFAHYSEFVEGHKNGRAYAEEGNPVNFEPEQSERGPRAKAIHVQTA